MRGCGLRFNMLKFQKNLPTPIDTFALVARLQCRCLCQYFSASHHLTVPTAMPMLVPSCQYSCSTVPSVCVHSVLYSEAALDFPPLLARSSLVHTPTNNHPWISLIQATKSTFRLVVSTRTIVRVLQKQNIIWPLLKVYTNFYCLIHLVMKQALIPPPSSDPCPTP